MHKKLERVWTFNQSKNWNHHMKDRVDSSLLTKFDAFMVNRNQVIDVWFFPVHASLMCYPNPF